MRNNSEHMLWVEKYRPQKVEEAILPTHIKKFAQGIVAKGELTNMTLSGPAGTGKTTLALALASELGYESLVINGSDEGRLFETLRNRIKQFASTISFTGQRKLVILDEADNIPQDVQLALRGFIESSSMNCSFILTCNFPQRIQDALRSRCPVETFIIPKEEIPTLIKEFYLRTKTILAENNVEVRDEKALVQFISKNFPDWRKTLNLLQKHSNVGFIDATLIKSGDAEVEELMKFIKAKNFPEMRKWVAANGTIEMASLSRTLYNKMDKYFANSSKPMLALILARYQYQHAFVADAEINIVAMLVEVMSECEMT